MSKYNSSNNPSSNNPSNSNRSCQQQTNTRNITPLFRPTDLDFLCPQQGETRHLEERQQFLAETLDEALMLMDKMDELFSEVNRQMTLDRRQ
jgi:hypothetical protein